MSYPYGRMTAAQTLAGRAEDSYASVWVEAMDGASTAVEPHAFVRLGWRDRLGGGRCHYCLLPRSAHPVRGWTPARALGDRSKARRPAVRVTTGVLRGAEPTAELHDEAAAFFEARQEERPKGLD